MANFSKITIDNNTYDVKDETARNNLNSLVTIYSGALGDGLKITSNGNTVYYTTTVESFSNNESYLNISSLSLNNKPKCVILTCCNQPLAMQYDYDNSTNTSLRIVLIGGAYSGLIRFSLILATNE